MKIQPISMHVYQKNNYSNHKNVNFGWSTIETPPPKSTFEKFVEILSLIKFILKDTVFNKRFWKIK